MSHRFYRNALQEHSPGTRVKSLHLLTTQKEDFRSHTPPVRSQRAGKAHRSPSQAGIIPSSQLFTGPSATSLRLPCFHPDGDSPKTAGACSGATSAQLKVYTSQSVTLTLPRLLRCRSKLLTDALSCRHDGVELFHVFGGKGEQQSQSQRSTGHYCSLYSSVGL